MSFSVCPCVLADDFGCVAGLHRGGGGWPSGDLRGATEEAGRAGHSARGRLGDLASARQLQHRQDRCQVAMPRQRGGERVKEKEGRDGWGYQGKPERGVSDVEERQGLAWSFLGKCSFTISMLTMFVSFGVPLNLCW